MRRVTQSLAVIGGLAATVGVSLAPCCFPLLGFLPALAGWAGWTAGSPWITQGSTLVALAGLWIGRRRFGGTLSLTCGLTGAGLIFVAYHAAFYAFLVYAGLVLLAAKFTGSGLLPTSTQSTPNLLLAVAGGAGIAVFLASRFGLPVSTTHALTGALTGAGLIAAAGAIHWSYLGKAFLLPLLFAPFLAAVLAAAFYGVAHIARLRISPDACVCAGWEEEMIAAPTLGGAPVARTERHLAVRTGHLEECAQSYSGTMLGLPVAPFISALHFLSAGAVSFARGLNDTPKIAALLLILPELAPNWLMLLVGLGMALGGLFSGRHVAETMSYRLTSMNGSQGLTSNLATALLVTTASLHGLPVSTTHVSVGTLLGMGTVTRRAKWCNVSNVLAAWVVILPASALFAALIYFCLCAIL
jgi:PiT family inorganic phosphate transporter